MHMLEQPIPYLQRLARDLGWHSLKFLPTLEKRILISELHNTAWDSEIESLTSLNPSLIELDRRKTRRRHRVTAALAPRKGGFLPCNANRHASFASLKHGLPPPSFFEWSSLPLPAHRLVVVTHAIVKLRCKKETVESWQQSTLLEKTARIRVLVFLFFHFPSVVVRSSKIEVFGMATVGRGYNEPERRRVFKTLLDAGVESTRELSERSGLCKAPNETKERLKWESGKR